MFLLVSCGLLPAAAQASGTAPAAPVSVEDSVREAFKLSPQVRAARATLESARIQAGREKPVARPTVTAIASGTVQGPRVDFPRPDNQLATVLPEGVARLDLIVEQPLYRAGFKAAKDRYAAQLSAGELDFRKALSDIALAVHKAYIDVLRSDAGVSSASDGVDAAVRYKKLVDQQIASGVAKPVDSNTADAQVAEAQAGLTRAEGAASLARLNFNRTIGRSLSLPVEIARITALPIIPASADAAVARAIRIRPEILLLEKNLDAARAGISLAKAQSRPSVNARGQVTEQTPSAFQHEHYYAATLEVRWPLIDGGKARQDSRDARAQTARLEALLEDARQGVALEVMQAWQKMREAESRMQLAQTQRKGAEATEQVAEKAYEVGRSTALEVQSAQREVRTARSSELLALYDLHAAYADFLYGQGDLLSGIQFSMGTESHP